MTLQGALRYDRAWSYFPEQRVGPTRFLTTGIVFPQTEGVSGFNDITPRFGLAYDVFGTGKTSLKINVGKYLGAASALGIYSAPNPVTRISTSASRTWTDNGNFVPDCDLLNPAAQDLRSRGGDFVRRSAIRISARTCSATRSIPTSSAAGAFARATGKSARQFNRKFSRGRRWRSATSAVGCRTSP